MIIAERRGNMERYEYIQCCHCGSIHRMKIMGDDDDLYIYDVECRECGNTKHLLCGEDESDIYAHYDPVMDKRFYEYNTK